MRKVLQITLLTLIACQALAAPLAFEYVIDDYSGAPSPKPQLYTDRLPTGFSKVLCFVWRLVELICVLLLIIDVISRVTGKALYFIHASRYIIFTFGASACLNAGIEYRFAGSRGYMTIHLSEFLDDMYTNYLGWNLPFNIHIFNGDNYMFSNTAFVEQCILFFFLIVWGIMKLVLGSNAMMSKVYHLIKSLFLVFFISFMFHLIFWGGLFCEYHSEVTDANGDVKFFGYYFSWFLVFFWMIVACFLIYSMVKTVLDPIDGDKTLQSTYEQPDFVHERNELTDATSNYIFLFYSYPIRSCRTRKRLLH